MATFEVGPEQLSYHGPDLKRVVEPGRFRLMVGGSSAEVKSGGLDVWRQRFRHKELKVLLLRTMGLHAVQFSRIFFSNSAGHVVSMG